MPRLWEVMFEEQTCSSCGFESIDGGEFFLLRKDTFHGALGNFELCFSHEFMREMADELVDGVHFYTRVKTVTTRWPEGIKAGAAYAFPTMN